ncbi:MAG: hypothetical protein H0Z31_08350 [Bacillus sp. (in: Bacteria)]|nr:hypothetical protein [Bacillus sp. (in: firmicutes)]
MLKVMLPPTLAHPLFFPKNLIFVPIEESEQSFRPLDPLFYYELMEKTGNFDTYPWNEREKFVPKLVHLWNERLQVLSQMYHERQKGTERLMIESIALFFMMIFWSNGRPVCLNQWELALKDCSLTPVNVVERLTFIVNRPFLYHSFIQLQELFQDQQKRLAKALALNKKKSLSEN